MALNLLSPQRHHGTVLNYTKRQTALCCYLHFQNTVPCAFVTWIQDCHGKSCIQQEEDSFTSKLDLNLRKKLIKCYIWSTALYGAETWALRAADQKYLGSFEMWCWRRMEKISWTDHVRYEEVLLRVNEQRNILQKKTEDLLDWSHLT